MVASLIAKLLANKFVRIFLILLVAFTMGAGIATYKVSTHYIHKINLMEASYEAQVHAAAETAKAVDIVVVTKYKTKVVTIEQKKKDIDQQIEDKVTNEDDHRCTLGPEFVRLHNLAASPVPDATSGSDGKTSRARRPNP